MDRDSHGHTTFSLESPPARPERCNRNLFLDFVTRPCLRLSEARS